MKSKSCSNKGSFFYDEVRVERRDVMLTSKNPQIALEEPSLRTKCGNLLLLESQIKRIIRLHRFDSLNQNLQDLRICRMGLRRSVET